MFYLQCLRLSSVKWCKWNDTTEKRKITYSPTPF